MNSINRLLVKLTKFGTVDRRPGSGRRCSVRTDENVETVQLLVMCQEENLRATEQFHVRRDPSIITFQIIHKDLRLKCCKKRRAQQLTEAHSMHA